MPSITAQSRRKHHSGMETSWPAEASLVDIREIIRKLEDLTPRTIELLVDNHKEKITFPHLKVEPDEFVRLQERFASESEPTLEYFINSKEIVLLALSTPIHQHVTSALLGWLDNVGKGLSDNQQTYYAVSGCGIELADGSSKVPDTVLGTSRLGSYPIVTVETGFSETLEGLYQDGEALMRGSNGRIELVIILKVRETDEQLDTAYPRGQTIETLKAQSSLATKENPHIQK